MNFFEKKKEKKLLFLRLFDLILIFFLGTFGIGFWIFYHKEAERLLTFNPYYAKDQNGSYLWFSKGWMRFRKQDKKIQ